MIVGSNGIKTDESYLSILLQKNLVVKEKSFLIGLKRFKLENQIRL